MHPLTITAADVDGLAWPAGLDGSLRQVGAARALVRYRLGSERRALDMAVLEGLDGEPEEVAALARATGLVAERARGSGTRLPDPDLADAVNRLLTERTLLAPGTPRSRDGLERADTGGRVAVTLADGSVFYSCRGADLDDQLGRAAARLERIADPSQRALSYIAVQTYLQPYADGNKRTARLVADAFLLERGIEPPEVSASARVDYHRALTVMFATGDLGAYAGFLAGQVA